MNSQHSYRFPTLHVCQMCYVVGLVDKLDASILPSLFRAKFICVWLNNTVAYITVLEH